MGGWMPYSRMRERNNLSDRFEDFYPVHNRAKPEPRLSWHLLSGDLNRMEADYLNSQYPQPPYATRSEGSDPSSVVAQATGVDIETVRKVLRFVFLEQTS